MTVCQVAELVSIHSANEGVRRDRERDEEKKMQTLCLLTLVIIDTSS